MNRKDLLARIKDYLKPVYQERLQGIVLYGSEARKDAGPDSDIDLLILLTGPINFGRELETIINTLYPLQLEVIRPLQAFPVDIERYRAADFSLFRQAQSEGLAA